MSLFNEVKSLNCPYDIGDTSDKILLIDADTIVYAVCCSLEYGIELFDESFYTKEELEELKASSGYDKETNTVWKIDLDQVLILVKEKISTLRELTGCKDVELHFTTGKNFRYSVVKSYKANRKSTRYPQGLIETKKSLLEIFPGSLNEGYEADDIVCMLKREYPDKYIVCAVDKDVLKGVEGIHYNYYENQKYNIPMKWVNTTREEALKQPYIQCLMGDSADGIPGVKGIGPKTAQKLLKDATTEEECWEIVCSKYDDKQEAINTMRLVSMSQLNKDKELELWIEPLNKKEVK